jgi:hypothetical protein
MNSLFADELKAKAAAISRRQQNSTDTSDDSVTVSLADAIHQNIILLEKLSLTSPEAILKRAFSTKSALSTTSTFALEQQTASTNRILQFYGKIGYGRCGHVFELSGTGEVAKVAVDQDGLEVYNEFYMQQKIRESLQQFSQQISLCSIPTLREYVAATDTQWWENHGPRFPEEHRQPRSVLISERILPLPKIVRHALIDKYCPDGRKEAAIADPINRDCLVRVYLGQSA